jgi:Fe2+ transport system protein B
MADIKFKLFGKDRKIDDKLAHQIAGTLIAMFFSWLIYFFSDYWVLKPALFGFLISVAFGWAKEMYDKYIKKTEFGMMDFFATCSGGSVGAIVFIVLFVILTR